MKRGTERDFFFRSLPPSLSLPRSLARVDCRQDDQRVSISETIPCQITLPSQRLSGALPFCIPGCGFSIFSEEAYHTGLMSVFVAECSGVHCDMLLCCGHGAGGRRWRWRGRVGVGGFRAGGISLAVCVSQVQEVKNENEKG